MRRDASPPESPYAWIRIARADLILAHAEAPDGFYELLCFHAQQAAEKAIKSVLISLGIEFPKTHDIQLLASLLPAELAVDAVFDSASLTQYAAVSRPGLHERVDKEAYLVALRLAEAVVAWAASQIAEPSADTGAGG